MSLGLFDVLGPVMHGPSSNHTAGANRIGFLAGKLMGAQPARVELGFHPAYMGSYAGQRSHTGLIAGCLGLREYDDSCMDALSIAKERGMDWSAHAIAEMGKSRNTMRVTGRVGEDTYIVNGDSVGGGNILIDAFNGLPVHLTGNEYSVVLVSAERTLLEEAMAFYTDALGEGLLDAVSGQVLGEKSLGCITAGIRPPDAAAFPERLRGDILNGALVCRVIEPLYEFCDHGDAPLFTTFEEWLALSKERDVAQLAVEYECQRSRLAPEQVLRQGRYLVSVIYDALHRGDEGKRPLPTVLTDPTDAAKLFKWSRSGRTVGGELFARGLARAVQLSEMNAASCRIVASPTGGASGALPAALLTAAERYERDDETLARAFLVSAAIGVIIGNKASFSGTVGGCQSEVGVGAAMGAGAIAYMAGGTPEQIVHSAAIALKNVLGLTCDPPAPAVEVPCIKRNAMGVAIAFFGAEMGLAGVCSAIEPDDVVSALADTQKRMPMELKFSHIGGLAGTASGKKLLQHYRDVQASHD